MVYSVLYIHNKNSTKHTKKPVLLYVSLTVINKQDLIMYSLFSLTLFAGQLVSLLFTNSITKLFEYHLFTGMA